MLQTYFQRVYKTFKAGNTVERSYYPDLKQLFEDFLHSKGVDPNITIEAKKTEAGIPDFTIRKGKELIGYVEAKDLTVENLETVEDTDQIKRYKEKLPNFILTNYFDFWLWRRDTLDEKKGKWIKKVRIGQPITLKLNTAPPPQNEGDFLELLQAFFNYYIPERKTAKALAKELAHRANLIPSQIVYLLKDNKEEEIDRIFNAFREYLIADLKEEDFADIYAQTIAYGLFIARLRQTNKEKFDRFIAERLIPKNIQILHDTFALISSQALPEAIAVFTDDIATVLAYSDIENIKKELHREKGGDDPLMHFYETFLAEYSPEKRKARGVYYTPLPVVSYITRSINILLKEKFNKKLGFASEGVSLLDPASGTLTFPANAIMIAHDEVEKSSNAGSWLRIIKDHILKEFFAFEILMAPYIIGHLKVSLLLEELGYTFKGEETLDHFQLYLTNTLDMSDPKVSNLPFVGELAKQAKEAKRIKEEQKILVVMGNPPYSGHSSNIGEWISKEIKEYYQVDGHSLGEKNPKWLQDDYVKFIRFAQWKIDQAGEGILGFITNHSYLDNPTFRGMRQSLMKSFNEIYILDLHGNSLKKEKCPDGSKDENVFDIKQGVAIVLFIKRKGDKGCNVYHSDLWGLREEKYAWLKLNTIQDIKWKILNPKSEFYFFIPRDEIYSKRYDSYPKITDIFPINGVGITTARDAFAMDKDKASLISRIQRFKNHHGTDDELHMIFQINKKKGWSIRKTWNMLQQISDSEIDKYVQSVLYRPFDAYWIYYHDAVVWRTVKVVMSHMIKNNLALLTLRKGLPNQDYSWIYVSNTMVSHGVYYNGNQSTEYVFPLYLYSYTEDRHTLKINYNDQKQVNINKNLFLKLLSVLKRQVNGEELFYYIYAVLHSKIYRKKYSEFLKSDFPRVPFTRDKKIFEKLSKLGQKLVELHLLKSPMLGKIVAKFPVTGSNKVEKREYKNNHVYINEEQYFEGVPQDVWEYFIGGYQVLDKWLKDRVGRVLSPQDVDHYLQVITALFRTIKLQQEIDEIYPEVEKSIITF